MNITVGYIPPVSLHSAEQRAFYDNAGRHRGLVDHHPVQRVAVITQHRQEDQAERLAGRR
nr:hypothetical protein [Mesorhizobium sp.]